MSVKHSSLTGIIVRGRWRREKENIVLKILSKTLTLLDLLLLKFTEQKAFMQQI